MPAGARRALLWAVGAATATMPTLLVTATPAAAHDVDGGSLPAPPWLLGYLGAFAALAAALVLRGSWTRARLAPASGGVAPGSASPAPLTAEDGPRVTAGALIALALLVAVLVAAAAGENLQAANVAPVAVTVVWWVGLPLACLLAGNLLRVANPFVPMVALLERVLPRRAGAPAAAPAWTAGLMLLGFRWSYLAYFRPGSPRAVALLLVLYTAVAVSGGWWWGRAWLLTGEGFGALSTALGGLARGRIALPALGLLALAAAWLGTTAFDAVSATGFWADVLGSNRGWARTLVGTVGLVWVTGIVAAAELAVARLVQRRTEVASDRPARWPAWLATALGAGLLAMALAWFVAHDLTLLLFEGQNFVILLSDPLGRGWDLLGTLDHGVDVDLVQAGWVRAVQLAALLAGHVGAVVLAHDLALRAVGRHRGMAVTWSVAALAAVSIVAAALLVLG